MANLPALLGQEATKALTKSGTKAVSKTATKALTKAIEDTATKAATKALTKASTKALTGAGVSTLAKGAGSTLDGILGRSSGITLPNATPKTLSDYFGSKNKTAYDLVANGEIEPSDLPALKDDGRLTAKELKNLKDGAISFGRENQMNAFGGTTVYNKSQLPKIRTSDYIEATGNRGKDIPKEMRPFLSENGRPLGVADWAETFPDLRGEEGGFAGTYDDILAQYESLINAPKANEFYTPDNLAGYLYTNEDANNRLGQAVLDSMGDKKTIPVEKGSASRGLKVDVKRPTAMDVKRPTANSGMEGVSATVEETGNPALQSEINDLRSRIGGYGGGNIGGGTTTQMPGSDGFNVRLKNGETTNIQIAPESLGSTKQQRAVRNLNDMTAKSMNASNKQYQKIVGKSGSIDGHYKSVAERMRAEKIDQANVADKAQSALALREDIKQQGLRYAEKNGVTINLSGVDNTIGLSTAQKKKLDELGLGLNNMLGDWSGAVSPVEAENIYKTLRDYAYNWSDSKDALTKMAGNACQKEAEAVRGAIDNVMDNINVDYKTPLIEGASTNGEDPAYLRKIAQKSDFKFSDLRKDQSDWVTINDLAGNKIKNEPTLNIAGIDTGIPNPLTAGAEKIKEKYYENIASGGSGFGGRAGGTGTAEAGASGQPNSINFQTTEGARGGLGGLLGKAKDVGLVGGGILGGLLLGGGGSGSGDASLNGGTLGDMLNAQNMANQQEMTQGADPYYGMTIGGYSYDQLEQGYMAATMAGDGDAAKLILNMIGMLEDKADRYAKANKSTDKSSNASSAVNVLSELYNLYGDIKGGTGPIAGYATNFLNNITGGGYNTEANTYWQVAQGALGKLIKGMGDTGALSEGDQKRALQMIPTITDTREAAEQKFKALYQILMQASS